MKVTWYIQHNFTITYYNNYACSNNFHDNFLYHTACDCLKTILVIFKTTSLLVLKIYRSPLSSILNMSLPTVNSRGLT